MLQDIKSILIMDINHPITNRRLPNIPVHILEMLRSSEPLDPVNILNVILQMMRYAELHSELPGVEKKQFVHDLQNAFLGTLPDGDRYDAYVDIFRIMDPVIDALIAADKGKLFKDSLNVARRTFNWMRKRLSCECCK